MFVKNIQNKKHFSTPAWNFILFEMTEKKYFFFFLTYWVKSDEPLMKQD